MIPLRSAPRWLFIANAFVNMLFVLPVLVLFYEYKGVTIGDFFLIQGISRLFIFVMEVPTGYIGDIFSRKYTVVLGFTTWILGYLLWIFGYGFWLIILGELIFSIAISLISGTIEAYLYDLLKKRHKEGNYHLKLAKMETVENIGLMVAILSGAFLYQLLGPTAPLWFSVICLSIAVGIVIFLPDVPESKRIVTKEKSKWQDILDISRFSVKNKEIKWLMIFPAIYGTFTLVFWWGVQPVMIAQKMPIFAFRLITSIAALMRTLWSAVSGKLLEKLKLSGVIKILSLTIALGTCGACLAVYVPFWCAFFCLFLMIIGSSSSILARVTTSVLVNHRIKSDERATVLSVKSMFDKAFSGLGMICLKPLFDGIGIGPTFMVSALILIPIFVCARHLYKMKLETLK